MTLVLALGVQGIVDAVTTNLPEGPTVDLDANQVNGPMVAITITPMPEDTEGVPVSATTIQMFSIVLDPLRQDRTNTNEKITISTSGIQLTSPTFTTSLTLSESTTSATETNTRQPLEVVTLNGYFTRVGVATLTISYTDLSGSSANEDNQSTERNIDGTNYSSSRSRTFIDTRFM